MPAIISTAPGKTILFGEHAVVYGQPAIAIPVREKYAKVKIFPLIGATEETIQFIAPQIELMKEFKELEPHHPLKVAVDEVKKFLKIDHIPSCKIQLETTIPISSGLGSSASISVALIKGLFDFVGFSATPDIISNLAFQVEIEFHGFPSGIDNTVIAYNKPILFQKNKPIELLASGGEFSILIADSGIKGNTKTAIAEVRDKWQQNPELFNQYFERIGEIVISARKMMEIGNAIRLGKLMTANQQILESIGVSHPIIEKLIDISMINGALGAKLCGGGLGGNLIALVDQSKASSIAETLLESGAVDVIHIHLDMDKPT